MNYKLIVKKGGNVLFEKKFVDTEISQKGLIIGRSDDAFLKFDDRAVSREHARIINKDGSLQIEKRTLFGDIRVNGQNISGSQKLTNYDYIEIPPYMIALEEDTIKNVGSNLENKSIALDLSGTSASALSTSSGKKAAEVQNLSSDNSIQLAKQEQMDKDNMLAPLDDFGSPAGNSYSQAPQSQKLQETSKRQEHEAQEHQNDFSAKADSSNDSAFGNSDMQMQDSQGNSMSDSGDDYNGDDDGATKVLVNSVLAKLVCTLGPSFAYEYQLNKSETFLGRDPSCEVSFNDKRSSRKNTLIRKVGARFFVKDLDSSNGTFINGKRLDSEEIEIQSGDILKIGDSEFEFTIINQEYDEIKDNLPEYDYKNALVNVNSNQSQSGNPLSSDFSHNSNQMIQTDGMSDNQVSEFSSESNLPGNNLSQDPFGGQAVGGAPATDAFGNPQVEAGKEESTKGKPILIQKYRKFKAWLEKQPPLKRYAVIAAIFFGIWVLLEDDPQTPQKPGKKAAQKAPKADANGMRAYESLPQDTKKFVDLTFNTAMEYYSNRDYYRAKFELQKIFDMKIANYPKEAEAQTLLSECERAIKKKLEEEEEQRRREEAERIRKKIDELVVQCKTLLTAKRDNECIDLFPKILELDPNNVFVDETRKMIEDKRLKAEALAAKKADIEKKRKVARGVFEKGKRLYDMGKYHDAIPVLMTMRDQEYRDEALIAKADALIRKALEIIRTSVAPLIKDGRSALDQGDLVLAKKKFQSALKVDPPNKEAQRALNGIRQQLHDRAKKFYTEGVIAESLGEIKEAVAKFRQALDTAPEDDEYEDKAQRKLSKYQVVKDLAGDDAGADSAPTPNGGGFKQSPLQQSGPEILAPKESK